MSTAKFTSFLVKVASRCNLDCDYCYIYHHADQSWRHMPKLLSADNWSAFARRLAVYVQYEGLKRCVVVLHGGEPLLAGADLIVARAEELRATVGSAAKIDIGLQTNGLLLTEQMLGAFEQANITVSLSIDGPQEANDLHRNTRRGRSSFKKTLAGLELLKVHPSIFAGVIAVVDPRIAPEILFEFFDAHRPPKVDFLLPDAHHLRPPQGRDTQPNLYKNWLIRAFDLWLDVYPHLTVRTFEALLDAAAGLPSGTDAFGLGDVSLVTIETDGSYHDLDVLKIVGEGVTRLDGSVRDTDIITVANSPAIAAHRRLLRREGLCETCQACPEVGICGGGSLPHRYGPNGFNHPTVYCDEMLALVGHVRNRLEGMLAASAVPVAPNNSCDLDLTAFELAEEGATVMAQLRDRAFAEQQGKFLEALELITARQAEYAPLVESIRALPEIDIVRLAARPGSVAWQRAVATGTMGRAVYAVDGTPLTADGSYLSFLKQLERPDIVSLSIGDDDPWLRAPFGSAIYFETEEITGQARLLVGQALEIIDRWRPALALEMREACRAIQFVRDPAAHPDKIVSFSDNIVPGALFVSVLQGEHLIDPYDLADSLIHEHRHQKLYLLERLHPMVETTNLKVVSPWREDLRPPSGLLHALFVFVELRRFWDHVRNQGPLRLRTRAINQLLETDAHLKEAVETLKRCPLTPTGRALASVLDYAREQQRAVA